MATLSVPTAFTEDQSKILRELFGEPVAADQRIALYNSPFTVLQPQMRLLARAGREPLTVTLPAAGERQRLSDGLVYQLDENGCWQRAVEH